MIALDLLHLLGLGGLCGLFGQLIRGVLGLKKAKHFIFLRKKLYEKTFFFLKEQIMKFFLFIHEKFF